MPFNTYTYTTAALTPPATIVSYVLLKKNKNTESKTKAADPVFFPLRQDVSLLLWKITWLIYFDILEAPWAADDSVCGGVFWRGSNLYGPAWCGISSLCLPSFVA